MKITPIATAKIKAYAGHEIILTYSVTFSGKTKEYGISVLKDDGNEYEVETVPNISPDEKSVLSLIGLLCSNTVTPVSLKDVVYDFLCGV